MQPDGLIVLGLKTSLLYSLLSRSRSATHCASASARAWPLCRRFISSKAALDKWPSTGREREPSELRTEITKSQPPLLGRQYPPLTDGGLAFERGVLSVPAGVFSAVWERAPTGRFLPFRERAPDVGEADGINGLAASGADSSAKPKSASVTAPICASFSANSRSAGVRNSAAFVSVSRRADEWGLLTGANLLGRDLPRCQSARSGAVWGCWLAPAQNRALGAARSRWRAAPHTHCAASRQPAHHPQTFAERFC